MLYEAYLHSSAFSPLGVVVHPGDAVRKLRSIVYYTLNEYQGLFFFWVEGEFLFKTYPFIRSHFRFVCFQLRIFNPAFSLFRRPNLILEHPAPASELDQLRDYERAWWIRTPTWSSTPPAHPISNFPYNSTPGAWGDSPGMDYPGIAEENNEARLLCDALFYVFEVVGCDRLLAGPTVIGAQINRKDRDTAISCLSATLVSSFSYPFCYTFALAV